MCLKWIGVWALLVFLPSSYQISQHDSTSYVAAVVEYSPTYVKDNGPSTLQKNTEEYIDYIKSASKQDADIIVFPEDGLTSVNLPGKSGMDSWTTLIPSASENYIPCTQNTINVSETLKKLSCAAKENRIYVVVNIAEKFVSCEKENCSTSYYNSNAVFDRTGKIIARYRKANLYEEPQFDTTETPEVVTFDTDFGVKFGTFICFDILFFQPTLNLTRVLGVTDFVYPVAWFSERPFLISTQTQFGWSFSQNVNLLASGYSRPESGNTGSGIFLGRKGIGKAILSRYPIKSNHQRLLISRVPKIKKNDASGVGDPIWNVHVPQVPEGNIGEKPTNGLVLIHESLASYKTRPFNGSMAEKVCDGDFCCRFVVRATSVDSTNNYRAAVFDGVRLYGTVVTGGIRICALVQCSDDSILSCGSVQNSTTTFTTLEISGKFDDYRNNLIMPDVLTSELLPFRNWTYGEHEHDDHVHLHMSLSTPTKNLATFGIYSRVFDRDRIEEP